LTIGRAMQDEQNPYAPPASPIGSTQPARQQPRSFALLVYLVGWSWPIILALCGVAADRVQIPTALKVVLSVASLLLPWLVARYGGRWRWGCAALLGAYLLLAVSVMWFWN
jgi:hypothetical protein